MLEAVAEGFPQLQEGNQEKFLNIVSGQSNTSKKTSNTKVPKTKPSPGNETLDISKKTKKRAFARLLEKFRLIFIISNTIWIRSEYNLIN